MRFARSRPAGESLPPPAGLDAGGGDAALVAAARVDRQAFRLLYERYVQQIYGFCYLRLGSRELAEDATSEVFVKALAGLGGFRGGIFAGWLYRIAQNVVTDTHRHGRRGRLTLPLAAADNLADPAQEIEETALTVRTALSGLPGDQRAVLELQLAGWSSEQIGAALGKSPSAIRMTRARAIKQLRGSLAGAGIEAQAGELPC
ncbi:MAG: RNA polymerase sigma factor [Vicinamibacterales bacterium]